MGILKAIIWDLGQWRQSHHLSSTRPSQSRFNSFKKLATNNRKNGASLAQCKNTRQPDYTMLGKGGLHARPRNKHQDPSYKNKQKKQKSLFGLKHYQSSRIYILLSSRLFLKENLSLTITMRIKLNFLPWSNICETIFMYLWNSITKYS